MRARTHTHTHIHTYAYQREASLILILSSFAHIVLLSPEDGSLLDRNVSQVHVTAYSEVMCLIDCAVHCAVTCCV
jgi:hypothetical protein